MVFQTEHHIKRAEAHIESGELERLLYACLELRYAIERITYQKLQLRLKKITTEEIGAWQPRRAMDRLMELVDENLSKDIVLLMAPNRTDGTPIKEKLSTIGKSKGLAPKDLGKHWQKLGSFLHIRAPKKKGQTSFAPDKDYLSNYLGEVISYIGELTSTGFDAHFSEDVIVNCVTCGQNIVRNLKLLQDQGIVQCQNPECEVSYIAHKSDKEITFEPYTITLTCKACNKTEAINANILLKMRFNEIRIWQCNSCSAEYQVRWELNYAPDMTKERESH